MCKFFPSLEKYVPNFTPFCRESELCCNLALLGVILIAFNFVSFTFTLKRETNKIIYITVASIDVWQSCFAHTSCQIHFTLFCHKFTFVEIYVLFLGKIVLDQTLLVKENCLFPCLCVQYGSVQYGSMQYDSVKCTVYSMAVYNKEVCNMTVCNMTVCNMTVCNMTVLRMAVCSMTVSSMTVSCQQSKPTTGIIHAQSTLDKSSRQYNLFRLSHLKPRGFKPSTLMLGGECSNHLAVKLG